MNVNPQTGSTVYCCRLLLAVKFVSLESVDWNLNTELNSELNTEYVPDIFLNLHMTNNNVGEL